MFALSKQQFKVYTKEFSKYSHPLLTKSVIVLFVELGDRWILQHYSGSAEQGYYGLALKVGSICFLFTSSMTPLFTREISMCYRQNNIKRIRRLFKKNIPLFYFIASYFSAFIAVRASQITEIVGGEFYSLAFPVLAVMAFYPMHQTYGQMSGAIFLATERTKIFRNIGVSTGIFGFLLSIVMLTPLNGYGLNMGALGLGIKMVFVQFVSVNIQLWINCKHLQLAFWKYIAHQIIVPIILVLVVSISSILTRHLPISIVLEFILTGLIYTIFTVTLLIAFPKIVAMNRIELLGYINSMRNIQSKM